MKPFVKIIHERKMETFVGKYTVQAIKNHEIPSISPIKLDNLSDRYADLVQKRNQLFVEAYEIYIRREIKDKSFFVDDYIVPELRKRIHDHNECMHLCNTFIKSVRAKSAYYRFKALWSRSSSSSNNSVAVVVETDEKKPTVSVIDLDERLRSILGPLRFVDHENEPEYSTRYFQLRSQTMCFTNEIKELRDDIYTKIMEANKSNSTCAF